MPDLYKPAKQLQMSRTDMDNLILRPGDAKSVKEVIIDGMAEVQSLKNQTGYRTAVI